MKPRPPTPEEFRLERERRHFSRPMAAAIIYRSGEWWKDCERGKRYCQPGLFRIWLERVDWLMHAKGTGNAPKKAKKGMFHCPRCNWRKVRMLGDPIVIFARVRWCHKCWDTWLWGVEWATVCEAERIYGHEAMLPPPPTIRYYEEGQSGKDPELRLPEYVFRAPRA